MHFARATGAKTVSTYIAMIFSENPWYNEPGRERTENPKASDQYNKQIQRWTVEHAILYWLNSRLAQPEPPAAKPRPGNPPVQQGGSRLLQSFLPTGSGGSKQAAPPYKPRSAIDHGPKPTLPQLPLADSKTFFNFLSPPLASAEPGSGIPTPPEPKMFHWMDEIAADGQDVSFDAKRLRVVGTRLTIFASMTAGFIRQRGDPPRFAPIRHEYETDGRGRRPDMGPCHPTSLPRERPQHAEHVF